MSNDQIFLILIVILILFIVNVVIIYSLFYKNKYSSIPINSEIIKKIISDKSLIQQTNFKSIISVDETSIHFHSYKMKSDGTILWKNLSSIILVPQIKTLYLIDIRKGNINEKFSILIAPDNLIYVKSIREIKRKYASKIKIITRFLPEIEFLKDKIRFNNILIKYREISWVEFNSEGKYLSIKIRKKENERRFILHDEQYRRIFEFLTKNNVDIRFTQ